MNDFLADPLSGYLAIALMAAGAALFVYLGISLPDSPLKSKWDDYVAYLNKYVRFLLLKTTGAQIARYQVVGLAALLVLTVATGNLMFLLLLVPGAVLPILWLDREKTKRIEKLEEQLDRWLLMLSNALKATPAIGEAIRSTTNLVQPPMAEELDLLVKSNQLGTPVDKAVLDAAERMESQTIAGALATIVIARQTGGDLPTILETSAASLREMARLEGVVRTKTSEGKGQVVVLAFMPFVMSGVLSWVDPTWLTPLTSNFIGYMILTVALTFWFVAIVWARNILKVDI